MLRFVRTVLLVCSLPICAVALATSPKGQAKHGFACTGGFADGYPCSNVDLKSRISLAAFGSTAGSSLWGWTDPDTQREYALMGLNDGTAFVDITVADHPVYLGKLPKQSVNSIWRELKTYGYYAYIVSEAVDHGMQVFDLRRLRNVANPPQVFVADNVYTQIGRAHNVVVNNQSGYAYVTGSRQGAQMCGNGLHFIDLANPVVPVFAGCFSSDGYTHDAQCVNYQGPDLDYVGHEICFAANEDTLTIVDVTNKANPVQIIRLANPYPGVRYLHQGWLTEDSRYFLINDELDEQNNGHNAKTYVMNVSNLDAPVLHTTFVSSLPNIDHNLFVKGRFAYQANYRAGLRVLDIGRLDESLVTEVAYFDTFPSSNTAQFNGAWNVYPFFASGHVIISDIESGLFVVKPQLCPVLPTPSAPVVATTLAKQTDLQFATPPAGMSIDVLRRYDGCAGAPVQIASGLLGTAFADVGVSGQVPLGYAIRYRDNTQSQCTSAVSACVPVQAAGNCSAPPAFAGVASVTSAPSAICAIDSAWTAAQSRCGGSIGYTVERSAGASFDPKTAVTLATDLTTTNFVDSSVSAPGVWSYRVRAVDSATGLGDSNSVTLNASAAGAIANGSFKTGAERGEEWLGASGSSLLGSVATVPVQSKHVAWEVSQSTAASGTQSYHSGAGRSECLAMTSRDFQITPGQTATLQFKQRFDLLAGQDAGLVQVSTNGGSTWQTVTPTGAYPSTVAAVSSNACGFSAGTPVFSGSNLAWHPRSITLSGLTGSLRFRFMFSSSANSGNLGWWIDDVVLNQVQVPGTCAVQPLLLLDGFEGE